MSLSTPVSTRQRRFAGPVTTQSTTQPAPRSTTRATGIPVLPAVDVARGTVTFQTPNGYHLYKTQEPEQLVDALTQAVRPARWLPELGTLVITRAQTGVRAGRNVGFRLATL